MDPELSFVDDVHYNGACVVIHDHGLSIRELIDKYDSSDYKENADAAITLYLSNPNVDDISMAAVGGYFRRLKKLYLQDLHDITKKAFDYLPVGLEELVIVNCLKIDDAALGNLGKLKNLEVLSISTSNITGSTFNLLPEGLRRLGLFDCHNLTARTTKKIRDLVAMQESECKTYIPTLQIPSNPLGRLIIKRCDSVNDDFISELSEMMDGLAYLSISDCNNITGSSFGSLPKGLKSLSLHRCDKVDPMNMMALDSLKKLKYFQVISAKKVHTGITDHLRKSIQTLSYCHYFRC